MNKTSDILAGLDAIKAMLEKITQLNDYNHTPAIKRGWLQHIFEGRSRAPVTFPVVAYRPALSVPGGGEQTENTSLNDRVTISIDCAVSVKESPDPVADLLNLLKDVRRSLVFDTNTTKLGVSEIVFLECQFDVPEAGEDYAFFSQKISFRVVEQYA